jgi:hypothetical protein
MGDTDEITDMDYSISTDSGTSTTTIIHGGTSGGSTTTRGDLHYVDEPDLGDEEEISEEVQAKINKLGTPGKRNIDDLLKSFKVVADSKKGAPLEELDDQTWMDEVMNIKEEPDTFVPADEADAIAVDPETAEAEPEDIRMGDESES